MHETIIRFFNFIKNILYFLRIVCVFCILMLLLYWIQNLTHANWEWMGFIKPFLDALLTTANNIYSVSFNLFGAVFEFKYLSALVILILAVLVMKLLYFAVDLLEGLYRSARFVCKKTEETLLNKKLSNIQEKQEKKLMDYSVLVNAQLKKKFAHEELNINLQEQIDKLNHYLFEKTSVKNVIFANGYLYNFTNFEDIDKILDILFKARDKFDQLEFAISIQIGNDLNQLKKLGSLKIFGKIIMAADTAYRYRFNDYHRYQTEQVGQFLCDNKNLEVHEFNEIL